MAHAMGVWLVAAAAALAAPASDEPPAAGPSAGNVAKASVEPTKPTAIGPAAPRSPRQLREAVHQAMVRSAKAGPLRASAIRQLAELHDEIVADTQMLDEDRDSIERAVRARLKKLKEEIAKTSAPRPAASPPSGPP